MGADAAVSVAIKGGGIAAGPAIALAGDQVNETRFLGLLHKSLSHNTMGTAGGARGGAGWTRSPGLLEVVASIGAGGPAAKGAEAVFPHDSALRDG